MGRYFKTSTLNMFNDFYSDPWKDINAKLVEKQTAFDTLSQHKDLLANQLEQFQVLRDDGIDGELLRRAKEYSLGKAQELQDYLIQTGDVDTVTREAANLGKEINTLYSTGDLGEAVKGKMFFDEMLKKNEEMFKGDPEAGDRYKAYWMNEYYKNGGKFSGSTLGNMFELINLPELGDMEEYAMKVLKASGYLNAQKTDDGQWKVQTKNGWEGISKQRIVDLIRNHLNNNPRNKRAIQQRLQLGMDPKNFLAGFEEIANYLAYGKDTNESSKEIGAVQEHALKNANNEFYQIKKEEREDQREKDRERRQRDTKLENLYIKAFAAGDEDSLQRIIALQGMSNNNVVFGENVFVAPSIKGLEGLNKLLENPAHSVMADKFKKDIQRVLTKEGFDNKTVTQVIEGVKSGKIKTEADLKEYLTAKGTYQGDIKKKSEATYRDNAGPKDYKYIGDRISDGASNVFELIDNTIDKYNNNRTSTVESTFTRLGYNDMSNITDILNHNPNKFKVFNEKRGDYENLTVDHINQIDKFQGINMNNYGGIITFNVKDKNGKDIIIQSNNEKASQVIIDQGSANSAIADIFKSLNSSPAKASIERFIAQRERDPSFAPNGWGMQKGNRKIVYDIEPDKNNPGNFIYKIILGGQEKRERDLRIAAQTIENYLNEEK